MMKKKWLPHFIAVVSLVLFIGLGLASDGTTPPPAGGGGGGGAGGGHTGCPPGMFSGRCAVNLRNRIVCNRGDCAATAAANAGNLTYDLITCTCG